MNNREHREAFSRFLPAPCYIYIYCDNIGSKHGTHLDKLAHGVEGGQVEVHDGAVGLGDARCLRRGGRLGEVTAGHDHMPVAALAESLCGCQPKPRGCSRYKHLSSTNHSSQSKLYLQATAAYGTPR